MLKIYLLVVKSSHDGATGRLIAPKEGSQGEGKKKQSFKSSYIDGHWSVTHDIKSILG